MADAVTEVLPEFSTELVAALVAQGDVDLAAQVRDLLIVETCGCGDEFCASFYVVPRPGGGWGLGHRCVPVDIDTGMVVLDVVDEVITYVEVLHRPDVAERFRRRAL